MFINSIKCCQNYLFQNIINQSNLRPARLPMINLVRIFHMYQGILKMSSTSKHNTGIIYVTENGSELTLGRSETT